MVDIKQIADEAEVIIDGYAFSKFEGGYRVLNLNAPEPFSQSTVRFWKQR